MKDKRFEKIIFLFAIVWYLLTAYFSNGYFHADEHYQVIEFAKFKLGTNQVSEMPWEFHEKIRSTVQPTLCFVTIKLFNLVSIINPYVQALILRLITSIFAVYAISYFSLSCKSLIKEKYWKFFYMLSFFIWFVPWINVRFSSETYSGLFFLIALAEVLKDNKATRSYITIGLLLGLSFVFRFQTIALTFGLIMWLTFIKKYKNQNILFILLGISFVTLIGTAIDCWFYNEFTFTPWNYFYSNILNDVASSFGTSPWHYYFYYIFRYSFFPIGILILFSFFFLLFKNVKSVFIWTTLPFIILHSIIPHKELRFLFPIINLIPIFIMLFFQELSIWKNQFNFINKRIFQFIFISMVSINIIGLIVSSLKPAGTGNIQIAEAIQKNNTCEKSLLVSHNGSNPFDPWNGLIANFYLEKNIRFVNLDSTYNKFEIPSKECIFLVLKTKDLTKLEAVKFIREQKMIKISESNPNWMNPILALYGGFDIQNNLMLYKSNN